MQQRTPSRQRDLLAACAAAAAVIAALLLGQAAAVPNLVPWYALLAKPWFAPPAWALTPVWTALYLLMGIALWRILRLPELIAGRGRALTYFYIQLALNVAWTWSLFALHDALIALLAVYPQLLFVLLAIAAVLRLDATAAWCLLPLAGWLTYVSAVNLAIWHMNG